MAKRDFSSVIDSSLSGRAEQKKYTITFQEEDGTVITSKVCEKGSLIEIPKPALKSGYTFKKWEPEPIQTINSDMTYTAHYERNETSKSLNSNKQEIIEEVKPKKQRPGRPRIKTCEYRKMVIEVPEKMFDMVKVAAITYNNNITAYIKYLINEDLAQNTDLYQKNKENMNNINTDSKWV